MSPLPEFRPTHGTLPTSKEKSLSLSLLSLISLSLSLSLSLINLYPYLDRFTWTHPKNL